MRFTLFILFTLLIQALHAQVDITGKVTLLPNNDPGIGVTIMVQGSSDGTITDFDGNYVISVPDRSAVLIFMYTGYETVEVPVGDRNQIDLALTESLSQLNEVIV